MRPNLSVVIPTRDRADMLRQALQSLAQQTVAPYEIIVVDDGSSDDIRKVLSLAAVAASYIRLEGVGPGLARNAGVTAANCEFIAFLDSDDIWAPFAVETIQTVLQTAGLARAPVVYCNVQEFHGDPGTVRFDKAELRLDVESDLLTASPAVSVATSRLVAIETKLFREVGGFWGHRWNSEDTDFAIRIGVSCPFVHLRSPVLVAQRIHSGQVSTAYEKYYRGMSEVIAREKAQKYPGGRARHLDRLKWVCAHSRSCCWYVAGYGGYVWSIRMYTETLSWNLRLLRFRFLVLFPAFLLLCVLTMRRQRRSYRPSKKQTTRR